MQTDLNIRVFDGRDEYGVALHDLSAIDDLASTSVTDTRVVGRLDATVPNVPFSAAIVDRTYLAADKTWDNFAMALRGGPHDEMANAWLHSHIALWSREYDLR
jgi:hypothetical protein